MRKDASHNNVERVARRTVNPVHGGFSLIELMIAMTIGLVLISGMIAVLSGNKRSSELNSAMANLQENARFAIDRMAIDIRSAGFQGCLDIARGPARTIALDSPTTDIGTSAASAYVVSDGNSWSPSAPTGFNTTTHQVKAGTHVLSLMFGGQDTFPIQSELSDSGGNPTAAGDIDVNIQNDSNTKSLADLNLEVGDLAIISDCGAADLFAISGITETSTHYTIKHAVTKNSTPMLSKVYGKNNLDEVRFSEFNANIYYVADTTDTNDLGDPIYALFRQSYPYNDDLNNPPVELVRGVENMRVSFGVNLAGNTLQYMAPDDADIDYSKIASVRIGLLMASEQSIAQVDDQATYLLAGQAISALASGSTDPSNTHATDRRYRLAFNTTVKIRNRRR